MIQMYHVSKIYPGQIVALSDVSLEVSPDEFTFITGPIGSGKSTLLRILYGAERPSTGEVIVGGIAISRPGFKKIYQLRRLMGIVSQDYKLLQDRTVFENMTFPLEVMGHSQKEAKRRASEMLTRVGLEERKGDPIVALSSGERQRVAIARALVHAPTLLLADEPTETLDTEKTLDIMELFTGLKGTTVIVATRNIALAKHYPYRIIHLMNGKRVDLQRDEEAKIGE